MRARGISLIEVVAALALIGTAITMLLGAQARSLEQLAVTRDRQIATELARELITAWRIDPLRQEPAREGSFASHPGWRWTRGEMPYRSTSRLALQEVTLTIHRVDGSGHESHVAGYTWLERPGEE